MTDATGTLPDETPARRGRSSNKAPLRTMFGALTLTLGVGLRGWVLVSHQIAPPHPVAATVGAKAPTVALSKDLLALLDPTHLFGAAPVPLAQSTPLGSNFVPPATVAVAESDPVARTETVAEAEPVIPSDPPPAAAADLPLQTPASPIFAETVPLPTPRPPELQARVSLPVMPGAGRRMTARIRSADAVPEPTDKRSMFERLFGIGERSGPAMAYAAPEDSFFGRTLANPVLPADRQAAVYDISAHTVTLPNGTRLEAHSGLGESLDDPRRVHVRMRGPTPPHIYELQPREQLFHGVRALRLNPVGGGGVFGRTGLLAHTYMLGPNGDSNGCVSFRNYDAFLQAYLNGEIKRLVVVARAI